MIIMNTCKTTSEHNAIFDELERIIVEHNAVPMIELLAIYAQITGAIIATIDADEMPEGSLMDMVMGNMLTGAQQMLASQKEKAGHA